MIAVLVLKSGTTHPDVVGTMLQLVVLRGAGEKAFCAGGDIKALYENGIASTHAPPPATAFVSDDF